MCSTIWPHVLEANLVFLVDFFEPKGLQSKSFRVSELKWMMDQSSASISAWGFESRALFEQARFSIIRNFDILVAKIWFLLQLINQNFSSSGRGEVEINVSLYYLNILRRADVFQILRMPISCQGSSLDKAFEGRVLRTFLSASAESARICDTHREWKLDFENFMKNWRLWTKSMIFFRWREFLLSRGVALFNYMLRRALCL